jgi:cytochrome c oxidase subunit II
MVSHAQDTTGFRFKLKDAKVWQGIAGKQDQTMGVHKAVAGFMAAVSATTLAGAVMAQDGITGLETIGRPHDGLMGFQPASSGSAADLQWLDGMIFVIITAIVVFVTLLLAWVALRHNSKVRPTPAKFTHNTPIEVAWTLIPIVILVVIAVFSLPILFKQVEIPTADITIKATGNQWYWSYEYPDEGVAFDSYLIGHPATITEAETGVVPYVLNDAMRAKLVAAGYAADEFLLATDKAMVIPVNKVIVVQLTGADVIHAWAVPAFGVMSSGVPGRISEVWFKADKEGVYFGQCTALCGKDHAYMPITVKVVSEAVYADWLARQKAAS